MARWDLRNAKNLGLKPTQSLQADHFFRYENSFSNH